MRHTYDNATTGCGGKMRPARGNRRRTRGIKIPAPTLPESRFSFVTPPRLTPPDPTVTSAAGVAAKGY